ncbi:HAD hydrolase-like protein [Nesterenkonia suensis]
MDDPTPVPGSAENFTENFTENLTENLTENFTENLTGGFSDAVVLFDLDGTLVDPAGSITGGIAAALDAHQVPVPDSATLQAMVGPPLAASLLALPGMREELVPDVVEHYRRGYLAHGMAASTVYPGVRDLLAALRAAGATLAVATSKPQPLAERLLEVQGLTAAFDAVAGSSADESVPHAGKGPILAAALESLGLAPGQAPAVMVGDRRFDVEGAHAHGMPCVGVSWGCAPAGELEAAGSDAVVDDAEGLRAALAGLLETVRSHRSTTPWHLTDSRP